MILVLDSGNSSIKYGLFENDQLIKSGAIRKGESLLKHLSSQEINSIIRIGSCSVTNEIEVMDLPKVEHYSISVKSNFPFQICYDTPETLGIDRIVAAAGAYSKGEHALIIDCGTCVTYDIVDAEKGYLGGGISPGIDMRFQAMNNFTDKLPLISSFEKEPELIGTSTETCMKSGAINGLQKEIEGFIADYKARFSKINVFLTGGDSIFFEEALKNSIFADRNLVLKGLNLLIKLNEK